MKIYYLKIIVGLLFILAVTTLNLDKFQIISLTGVAIFLIILIHRYEDKLKKKNEKT